MASKLAVRGFVVGACLLAFFSSACTPSEPTSPTPTPSASATTPTETAQEREEREAYAAAETSYREFRAEYMRLTAAGGASKATDVMKKTAGGDYLSEFTSNLRSYKEGGFHTKGAEVIKYVRPNGYTPESLNLNVCEDDSAVFIYSASGQRLQGSDILALELEVRNAEGRWRVWGGLSSKKVSSCE